jgi:hypothetical protein
MDDIDNPLFLDDFMKVGFFSIDSSIYIRILKAFDVQ